MRNLLLSRRISALWVFIAITLTTHAECNVTVNEDGYVVVTTDSPGEFKSWTDQQANKESFARMVQAHPDKIKFSGYFSNDDLLVFQSNPTVNIDGTPVPLASQSTVDMSDLIPASYQWDGSGMSLVVNNNYTFEHWKTNLQTAYLPTNAGVTEVPMGCFKECQITETPVFPSNIKRIKSQAFEKCTQLETVRIPATIEFVESQSFNNLSNDNSTYNLKDIYVECWSTGCANNAFDVDVTNSHYQMDGIFNKGATLHFEDDATCGTVNTKDAYGNETGYTYNSPYDYFVGSWKGDALITQSNISNYFGNFNQWSGSDKGTRNGWQEFAKVAVPNAVTFDHEILRTFSYKTNDGVLLPEGLTAYRAVDYVTTKSDNGKTIEGYLVLVPITVEVQYQGQTKTVSYVPANTGVVLRGHVTTQNPNDNTNAFAFMSPLSDLQSDLNTSSWATYPNSNDATGGAPYAEYSSDASNRTNYLVGSCADGLPQVTPVWPWPYRAGTVEYRNFALNKPGGVYRWVRIAPCQMPGNYAYAKIPATKFTNDNESVDQSPYLENDDQTGTTGSPVGLIFSDINYDPSGIHEAEAVSSSTDNAFYTLQGVRIERPSKGIFIHQHKKIIIK